MQNKKGLTIIEVVVAMFVLTVGLVSVIELIGRSIVTANNARDAAIATGLAQEGIEIVRNFRDQNMVDGNFAFESPNPFPNSANINNCKVDKKGTNLQCDNGTDKKPLYLKDGFYEHDNTGVVTKFRRKIMLAYWDKDDNPRNNPQQGAQDNWAVKTEIVSMMTWGWPDATPFPADLSGCTIDKNCLYIKQTLTTHD